MSMTMLTVLQFTEVLVSYLLLTVGVPALLFRKKLGGFSFSMRCVFCFIAGNFFVNVLTTVLQLLHICNRVTLVLFSVAVLGALDVRMNRSKPLAGLAGIVRTIRLLVVESMGLRGFLERRAQTARAVLVRLRGFVFSHLLDLLLLAGMTAMVFFRYGALLLENYGYMASDIIVHNYWINSLGEGQIYVAGVYPFGFHCVVYFLHALTGMDTYVILRVFWLVQTLLIHYMLAAFLKCCCTSRVLPYLGTAAYVYATYHLFGSALYGRYFSSLPQEFGMNFIFPSVCFLVLYFREDKKVKADKEMKNRCVAGFVMSLSMALSVHFYDAMVVGFCCIGGALGYAFQLFSKKNLRKIVCAGVAAIAISLLPMAAAYIGGTPLEGSLRWGQSIISGSGGDVEGETEAAEPEVKVGFSEKIRNIAYQVSREMKSVFYGEYTYAVILAVIPAILLAGLLSLCRKEFERGRIAITVGGTLVVLFVVVFSGSFGLPSLMQPARSFIYFTYIWFAAAALLADSFFAFWKKCTIIRCFCTALQWAVFAAVFTVSAMEGKNLLGHSGGRAFQTNGAVTCLTNIIHDNSDQTWTICSANDELRMADQHGYHTEISDLLKGIEGYKKYTSFTIPTQYVYFFIEKKPINYTGASYDGSGQEISAEGASRSIPDGGAIGIYQLENRWIMMSKMYYWAQEFQKLYPNEMKVYYETEDFVCYVVEQNTYFPYDFAIDYGYN